MSYLQEIERRFVKAEMRVDGEGRIEGYAAVFGEWAEIWNFRERVLPGAFARAVKEDDVRALFNHDPNFVLGRNRAGTLELSEDSKGLHYRITPPATQIVQDMVIEPIRRGDVTQSSFGFEAKEQEWRHGEVKERDLISVELWDVSPVTFPAYAGTSTGVRSLARVAEMLRSVRPEMVDERDMRQLINQLLALLPDEAASAEDGGAEATEGDDSTRARLALLQRRLDLATL